MKTSSKKIIYEYQYVYKSYTTEPFGPAKYFYKITENFYKNKKEFLDQIKNSNIYYIGFLSTTTKRLKRSKRERK